MDNEKTMYSTTLGELMADDYDIYLSKNKISGYDLEISGPDLHLEEKGIHEYAIESFAEICRNFLWFYDKLKEKEEIDGGLDLHADANHQHALDLVAEYLGPELFEGEPKVD